MNGGAHACCWPGCTIVVPARMWGCRGHWRKLPKRLQRKILDTYRPGQNASTMSDAYLQAFIEVQDWIKARNASEAPTDA